MKRLKTTKSRPPKKSSEVSLQFLSFIHKWHCCWSASISTYLDRMRHWRNKCSIFFPPAPSHSRRVINWNNRKSLKTFYNYYPVDKIAKKAVCRSVFFLTKWHCILSAEITKTHSYRLFFGDFAHWVYTKNIFTYMKYTFLSFF